MIRRVVTLVVIVAVTVFAGIFSVTNDTRVDIDLLFAKYTDMPLSFVTIGALATGVVIGLAAASLFMFRMVSERRKLRRALKTAETEITSLRSLPLQNAD